MRIALLGAGFSRNWGGWLVDELRGELFSRLKNDPIATGVLKASRNFEDALDELQRRVRNERGPEFQAALTAMQDAINECFSDMNQHFARCNLEFDQNIRRSVAGFLGKFDAIFSLNQD